MPLIAATADMRHVVVLGSTGSIGTQALDVMASRRDQFSVVAIAATGRQPELIAEQVRAFAPQVVAIADPATLPEVQAALDAQRGSHAQPRIGVGPTAVADVASMPADVVLNGLAGAAGLEPTLAALAAGTTVALANKESLIIGGPIVERLAKPGQIVPVDSEHSALAQCLRGGSPREVRRLILTASGGPFRGWSSDQLANVTVQQALNHPTWDMGPLVTINSATMMNKGLEIIEAHLLFSIPYDHIDVVVHPQSIVHSMVEFVDGSILAQASPPDMRLPIALGLGWPDRVPDAVSACTWNTPATWTFEPVDHEAFPAIHLAATVGRLGRTAPAVMNAADEVAVDAFLQGQLPFHRIVPLVAQVVADHGPDLGDADGNALNLDAVLSADHWARDRARALVEAGWV
jgi:1-deoxy-D-xylulose-5-phosphate reductoisomerase